MDELRTALGALPAALSDHELDELCALCSRRRAEHRHPDMACKGQEFGFEPGAEFEPSGRYGQPTQAEHTARIVRNALRRGVRARYRPVRDADGRVVRYEIANWNEVRRNGLDQTRR